MTNIPGNPSSAVRINPNQTIRSTIDFATDEDWFRTNLTAGITYGASLEGAGGVNTLTRTEVGFHNSTGTQLASRSGSTEAHTSFTPQSSGRYFVSADNYFGSETGTYDITLNARDTIVNNVSSRATLRPGQDIQSSIDTFGDSDYFRVQLSEGYTYGFTLSGTGTSRGLRDTSLEIRDQNGNPIVGDNTSNGPSHIGFTPSTSGTYFVRAGERYNDASGDYRLSMNGQDAIKGNVTTTTGLALNTGMTGRIDASNDGDFYRVVLRAGQTYTARVEGDGSAQSLRDTFVGLYDAAGNRLRYDVTSNGAAEITFTATQNGTFYIAAYEWGANATGNYQIIFTGAGTPLSGGAGNDTLIGDGGANSLFGFAGDDTLLGLEGNDLLEGGSGGDILVGGFGTDTAVYRTSNARVSVDLLTGVTSGGHAQGDALHQIENINGTGFADTLRGDHGNNALWGQGGNDTLVGRQGADMLDGGSGNDTLNGGSGADRLFGRNGNDVLNGNDGNDRIQGGSGNDRINGGNHNDIVDGDAGDDIILGGNGNDTLRGNVGNDRIEGQNGHDNLAGGTGADLMRGGAGNDRLTGGSNGDRLYGNSGNDTILGENGADILFGGAGNDRMNGGQGADILQGDAGNDIYVFTNGGGADTIRGMATGDRIDFSNHSFLNNFNQVQQVAVQVGSDVLIGLGFGSIRIEDLSLNQLDASDFLF